MNIIDDLRNIINQDRILIDEPMKNHTYFQIGGKADYLVIPGSIPELSSLLKYAYQHNIPSMVMGNGSNMLVRDGGIRGIVINTTGLQSYEVKQNVIIAECGITLEDLANIAMTHELTGLEFASGIPGTLGGAVVMNAGAYGGEMQDIVCKSQYLDSNNNLQHLTFEEHLFGYRSSFYQGMIATVTSVTLNLHKGDLSQIKERMEDLHNQRWEKQPMDQPSGGSVFKRPSGNYVGKLIDDCGLRGTRIGDAMISDKHCGFIVNVGNAKAKDVLDLIKLTQETVFERFDVRLEPELRIVGED